MKGGPLGFTKLVSETRVSWQGNYPDFVADILQAAILDIILVFNTNNLK